MSTGLSSSLQRRRVLAATSVSYFIVILDTSIVNVALERLSVSLAIPITGLQWVTNAYTLVFAALLLSGGTLGDRLGARNVYLAGLTVFTLASMSCALAVRPSTACALAWRFVSSGTRSAMRVPSTRPGATQLTVTSGASATARQCVR